MLKRHEIQVLRRAGHTWAQVAELARVSVGTARVAAESGVTTVDNAAERARRNNPRQSDTAVSKHSDHPPVATSTLLCAQSGPDPNRWTGWLASGSSVFFLLHRQG
jgi:hypothetical protein